MGIRRWLRELTAGAEERDVLAAMHGAFACSIGDLSEDTRARIAGVVEPLDDRRLVSPISARTVLGWGYKIQGPMLTVRKHEVLPFLLVEAGQRAVIDPTHAQFVVTATEFRRCPDKIAQPRLRVLLEAAGVADPPTDWSYRLQPKQRDRSERVQYRFSEWVIEPSMVVGVVGSGTREPDPFADAENYRERPTWIRITGSADHPLAITDELDLA